MEKTKRQIVIDTLRDMGLSVKFPDIETIIRVYNVCQDLEIALTLEETTRTINTRCYFEK
jgi:hypothetical protein